MESPLDQFKVVDLIPIKVAGYDLSFTNSALFMLLSVSLVSMFFIAALRRRAEIPGRLQSAAEIIYEFVLTTLNSNTLGKGEKYFPFVLTLFTFILMLNIFGIIPGAFTVTSHLSVTFTLAMIVFTSVTVMAFITHGSKFFSFFLPEGTPIFLAPLMIIIELFTYLTRPISLSIRLAANMMAGHILLVVITSFILMMGVWGWAPIPLILILNMFEIFVAVLQAYIFTILSCVYINDAINLH